MILPSPTQVADPIILCEGLFNECPDISGVILLLIGEFGKRMQILVTGGTGLLGNNVVRELLHRQLRPRVLVRETSDPRPLEGLDVDLVYGDIRDAAAVEAACQGVDVAIHAAGYVKIGWSDREFHQAINVEGAANVARAVHQEQGRLVHVSTVNTLGVAGPNQVADEESVKQPIILCPYVETKRAAEEEIHRLVQEGLDAVIVQPAFMLGPWDWKPSSGAMLLEVARRFMPFAPRGSMSLCDARDVAQGILAAMDRGTTGRNYILAGHNMSYLESWQLFAKITGTRAPWMKAGPLGVRAVGMANDLVTKITGKESELNSAATRLSGMVHCFSSKRAQAELGYQIRPVDTIVEDAWRWFCDHGYV